MGVTLALGDGGAWGGWTRAGVQHSIDDIALHWGLELTERWPGQPERRPVRAGMPCALGYQGMIALSGHIDRVDNSIGRENHTLSVTGRGLAGDLVDSDVLPPFEYQNITLPDLIARLVAPFGDIQVRAEVDCGKPFRRAGLQPGETVFAAIERFCRQRAVLPMMDTTRTLRLTRAGLGGAAPYALGVDDILRGAASADHGGRHSLYVGLGQQEHHDEIDTEQAAGPSARHTDTEISRYRPKVITAERQGDGPTLSERIRWQAAVDRGRSRVVHLTVRGWRAGRLGLSGPLWAINTLVDATYPPLGVAGRWLTQSIAMTLDRTQGTLTTLGLVPPDAYLPEPAAGGDDDGED